MSDIQSDAIRAQQLLNDELLQRMLSRAEAGVVDALASLTIKQCSDHTALIILIQQLQAVRALPDMLNDAVAAGKAAGKTPPAVA